MIGLYGDCINDNEKVMENKISIAKKGFSFLIYGGCLSFIFIVCFIFKIFI